MQKADREEGEEGRGVGGGGGREEEEKGWERRRGRKGKGEGGMRDSKGMEKHTLPHYNKQYVLSSHKQLLGDFA